MTQKYVCKPVKKAGYKTVSSLEAHFCKEQGGRDFYQNGNIG